MIAEVEARCPRDTAVPSVPPALCPRCSGRFKPFNPFRRPRARAHPFPPSPCPHLERLFDLEGAFPMTFRRLSAPPPTRSPPASLSPPVSVQVSAARGRDRGGAGGSRSEGTPPEPLSPRGGEPPPGRGLPPRLGAVVAVRGARSGAAPPVARGWRRPSGGRAGTGRDRTGRAGGPWEPERRLQLPSSANRSHRSPSLEPGGRCPAVRGAEPSRAGPC